MPDDVFARLRAPLHPDDIEWRIGATFDKESGARALALAYTTARAVMERLDEVVGPMNWTDEYRPVDRAQSRGWICRLTLRLEDGRTVYHEDGADEPAPGEFAEVTKAGLSDALKRAAVKFGIGRYLYYLGDTFVDVEKDNRGKYRFKRDSNGKPIKPPLPAWALPGGSGEPPEEIRSRTPQQQRAQQAPPQAAPKPKPEPRVEPPRNYPAEWPFDLTEKLGFGNKYPTLSWLEMTQGKPDGGRRGYLRALWKRAVENGATADPVAQRVLAVLTYAERMDALIDPSVDPTS